MSFQCMVPLVNNDLLALTRRYILGPIHALKCLFVRLYSYSTEIRKFILNVSSISSDVMNRSKKSTFAKRHFLYCLFVYCILCIFRMFLLIWRINVFIIIFVHITRVPNNIERRVVYLRQQTVLILLIRVCNAGLSV